MTYYNRIKELRAEMPPVRVGVGGWWKMRKGKNLGYIDAATGIYIRGKDVVTRELDWFPNINTNYALNQHGSGEDLANGMDYHHVGTDNTTPAATDTALGTHVANSPTNAPAGQYSSYAGSPDYIQRYTHNKRFGEGVAEGNLQEIGASSGSANNNMWSRALILDVGGSPTVFPVAADEWLDTIHVHELFLAHRSADGTGTVTIGADTYDYTVRPMNMDAELTSRDTQAIGDDNGVGYYFGAGGAGCVLGGIEGLPSGGSWNYAEGNGWHSYGSYVADSYTRDITLNLGLTAGNKPGGIQVLSLLTKMGHYQIRFVESISGTDPIPKDGTKTMTFTYNLTWARHTY